MLPLDIFLLPRAMSLVYLFSPALSRILKSSPNTLRWRHYRRDSASIHQPHDCLLNRLFRRRSKKISKLRVTGLCVGNSPGPVNSPHKCPVTRKMFPFDDVIMMIPVLCMSSKYTFTKPISIMFSELALKDFAKHRPTTEPMINTGTGIPSQGE